MTAMQSLGRLARLAPSRRRQWLALRRDAVITRLFHARRLRRCGRGSIVQKPLFWTPEHVEIGSDVLVWPGCRIEGVETYGGTSFSPSIYLGDGVSLQQGCHVTAAASLVIGDGTTVMCYALITDIDHEYQTIGVTVYDQPLVASRTEIGRNCLIGAGARIQAGTRLGEQCIVGANAVVRGDFPAYSVIAGVPGRVVKRYDPEVGSWRKTDAEGRFR